MNSEKFSEALSRGEILLRDFPRETEISEIVNFARAELAQVEARQDLDASIQLVRKEIYAGKFRDAVAAAEKAIARYPRQPDLAALLEQAKAKLKEEENRDLLQKRISEIRRNIAAEQHTNAVDLARQTLSTLGPDTQLTSLLRVAEMELAHKQEKKDKQQKQIAVAKKLLDEGEFDASAQAIQEGLETKLLTDKDPHVQALLKEVEKRKAAEKKPGATTPAPKPSAPPNRADVATDYVFLQRAPLAPSSSPERDTSAVVHLSETVKKVQIQPGIPAQASPIGEQIQKKFVHATVTIAEKPRAESQLQQFLQRATAGVRQHLLLYIAALLVVVAIIVAVPYFVPKGPSTEVLALASHAQQLAQQKNWPEALTQYQKLAGMSGPIAEDARDQAARLKNLLDEESSLYAKAQSAESSGNLPQAKQLYQELADLHGDREADAINSIAKLGAAEIPAPAAPPAKPSAPKSNPTVATRPPAPPKPKPEAGNCQLLESDYAKMLDRAERSRAQRRLRSRQAPIQRRPRVRSRQRTRPRRTRKNQSRPRNSQITPLGLQQIAAKVVRVKYSEACSSCGRRGGACSARRRKPHGNRATTLCLVGRAGLKQSV